MSTRKRADTISARTVGPSRSVPDQEYPRPSGRGGPAAAPAPRLLMSRARVAAPVLPAPQAPASRPRTSVRARFGELRTALAEGWEIVQPIFARPLWSAADDSTTAFNFVLRREHSTRLVTVPDGRTVERFIRDRKLNVDYGR